MSNATGRMATQSIEVEEHDAQTGAKRIINRAKTDTVSYEDTNFTSADSPAVLDVKTDLGMNGSRGSLTNMGPGDFLVEISADSVNYGGQHTLSAGEVFNLDGLNIGRIRLTFIDPTEYKAVVAA